MSNNITIKKENVMNAYDKATSVQKELLERMFGREMFRPIDITERIKTFADAVAILGNDNQAVVDYYEIHNTTSAKDILAFAKLRVIVEALNEGWRPTFSKYENRYYLCFRIYPKEEFDNFNEDYKKKCRVVSLSDSNSNAVYNFVYMSVYDAGPSLNANSGTHLSFKTRELGEYCGKQFIDIWADYLFA